MCPAESLGTSTTQSAAVKETPEKWPQPVYPTTWEECSLQHLPAEGTPQPTTVPAAGEQNRTPSPLR